MSRYEIAGLTLVALTLFAVLLFILAGLPWVALTSALAGAMWCKIVAEWEDEPLESEIDAIELELVNDDE
jgi:hypothetical protein